MRGRQLLDVAGGVAWRQLHNAILNPTIFIPSLAFPLLNFAAFAGGLAKVRDVPGFEFNGSYTTFQFVFVLLQSAAFSGVFSGFGVARVNPLTPVLEANRGLISGEPTHVLVAFSLGVGLVLLFAFWALGGLRRAEAAG